MVAAVVKRREHPRQVLERQPAVVRVRGEVMVVVPVDEVRIQYRKEGEHAGEHDQDRGDPARWKAGFGDSIRLHSRFCWYPPTTLPIADNRSSLRASTCQLSFRGPEASLRGRPPRRPGAKSSDQRAGTGRRRVVKLVRDPSAIERVLTNLGLPTKFPPRGPPRADRKLRRAYLGANSGLCLRASRILISLRCQRMMVWGVPRLLCLRGIYSRTRIRDPLAVAGLCCVW